MSSANRYYTKDRRQRHGPYTFAEMACFARSGQLNEQDVVWNEGARLWVDARLVPGLTFCLAVGGLHGDSQIDTSGGKEECIEPAAGADLGNFLCQYRGNRFIERDLRTGRFFLIASVCLATLFAVLLLVSPAPNSSQRPRANSTQDWRGLSFVFWFVFFGVGLWYRARTKQIPRLLLFDRGFVQQEGKKSQRCLWSDVQRTERIKGSASLLRVSFILRIHTKNKGVCEIPNDYSDFKALRAHIENQVMLATGQSVIPCAAPFCAAD